MKIKHIIVPLIIIAIIILWYILNEKEQPPKPINLVTKKVQKSPKVSKKQVDPNKFIQDRQKAWEERRVFLQEKQEREEPNLSYLQAYRDMKYYRYCDETYHALKYNQETKDIPIHYSRKNIQATDIQSIYHQNRINKCKSLIDLDDTQYISGQTRLRERFRRTSPKADNEKDLAHSLQLVKDLNRSRSKLYLLNKGEPSDPQLITKLILEMIDISKKYSNIKGKKSFAISNFISTSSYSDEQVALKESLVEQFKILREKYELEHVFDKSLYEKAQTELLNNKNKLTEAIKDVVSPDAFFAIMEELMKERQEKRRFSQVSNIAERLGIESYSNNKKLDDYDYINKIRSDLKLFDDEYYELIMSNSIEMTACSLGYTCDENADFIVDICLGLKYRQSDYSKYSQACGQSVVEYIINVHLTPNQLVDANDLMSYMMGQYE